MSTAKIEGSVNHRLILGDCLERMAEIEAGSVDLIAADLPYGTTACEWDTAIPFGPMWAAFKRVLKPRGAVVLTACQPFTSGLVLSNRKWFRQALVWEKTLATGFLDCRRKPMKNHEDVLVFAAGRTTYNPQMEPGEPYVQRRRSRSGGAALTSDPKILHGPSETVNSGFRYPRSVMRFSNANFRSCHPTQKPVALFEYLIRTYSNPGETVLDPTMGSGTTGVACITTGRRFIGIERDPAYFAVAERRIAEARVA
jgi:hypothetical protein